MNPSPSLKITMATKKHVLIVGGAGYIGSHVNKMLHLAGYETVVLDNLSRGNREAVVYGRFCEGDLGDAVLLAKLFSSFKFDAVMHFAAFTDIGESVCNPLKYYINNTAAPLVLLETMAKHAVKTFIFSSTAAVYGMPKTEKISEEHVKQPINPYGLSKLMLETILSNCESAYGIKSSCLRYFNAAGGDPDGEIGYFERKESNLIPLILKSLKDPQSFISIYGTDYPTHDGTCIRDYIHVNDLGSAHIKAMEQLFAGGPSTQFNLGTGFGYSVREVIKAAEKVTGLKANIKEIGRRAGDPPVLVAETFKAQTMLDWTPSFSTLEVMIEHAWRAMILCKATNC